MEKPRPRIQLPQIVIVKAPSLLPMLYKPAELAEDLNLPVRTLYDWLKTGVPHAQDAHGNLWINGWDFAGWVAANRKPHGNRQKLNEDQAYCLRCKQAVTLVDPRREHIKGRLILIKGRCPRCGAGINRGGCSDRTS